MSLSLPTNFENDIQGRDTALVPVIVIGTYQQGVGGAALGDAYFISTNNLSIQVLHSLATWVTESFNPILLNIPSLKESIDIEKRNYKISSVNLDISNFPYEGERFSELVSDSSLINTEVRIYWVSPSTTQILPIDIWGYDPSDIGAALQVFNGTIRRYTHDDEKVRLVVEDRSQATLHKDLPLEKNYLKTDDTVPDKYKGKPKPFVYGHVEKSPGVVSYSPSTDEFGIDTGFINVTFDNSTESKTVASESTPFDDFYVYKNDGYYKIPQTIQEEFYAYLPADQQNVFGYKFPIGENTNIQYIDEPLGSNIVELVSENNFDFGNPIYNDEILVRESKTPQNGIIISPTKKIVDAESDPDVLTGVTKELYTSLGLRLNSLHENQIVGTMMSEGSQTHHWQGTSSLDGVDRTHNYSDLSNITNQDLLFDGIGQYEGDDDHIDSCAIGFTAQSESLNLDDQTAFWIVRLNFYVINRDLVGTDPYVPEDMTLGFFADIGSFTSHDYFTISGSDIPEDDSNTYDVWNELHSIDKFYPDSSGTGSLVVKAYLLGSFKYQFAGNINIDQLVKNEWGLVKNVLKQEYYANVNGRKSDDPKAPEIIEDILKTELDPNINIPTLPSEYPDWKYAFTVDKKINSKKLIENIASASPYIPRFNNMGDFILTEIPVDGSPPDGVEVQRIKEAECIDFSFSRTKIEDVYTKIVFKYNWDYAREEFNGSVSFEIDEFIETGVDKYEYDYYGFTEPYEIDETHGGYIHPDSTLVIDDDRGKYIRKSDSHDTAQNFTKWYLMWSCNQHLKMKVKLPLKYMNLEIGDMVDFDYILGGVNYLNK